MKRYQNYQQNFLAAVPGDFRAAGDATLQQERINDFPWALLYHLLSILGTENLHFSSISLSCSFSFSAVNKMQLYAKA